AVALGDTGQIGRINIKMNHHTQPSCSCPRWGCVSIVEQVCDTCPKSRIATSLMITGVAVVLVGVVRRVSADAALRAKLIAVPVR
ncbi:hypothetical protein, partial [Mycobacteroides abscessus]|uniref:hypothetical protein n=1 Tax=Mycobacteroides abscessus TaxID=36809 RepID=UPI00210398B2